MRDEDEPRPPRGELRVRVHAVAWNFHAIALLRGRSPRPDRKRWIAGSDAAGAVVEVGAGDDAFTVGDRLRGAFPPGWFGGRRPATRATDGDGSAKDGWLVELKVVRQEAVVLLPDHRSSEQGSTLPGAGLTAGTSLTRSVSLRAGHTVLTQGTGGVSIFAWQEAQAVGGSVSATTSSVAKAERLRALGADEVVNDLAEPHWGERVRGLTDGRGVDRVVEVGGPAPIGPSLHAVAYGGEIASIGVLTRDNPGIAFVPLQLSGATIRTIAVGDRDGREAVARAVALARVKPVIDRVFDFESAQEAFASLDSGSHFGKVVIRCSAPATDAGNRAERTCGLLPHES